MSVSPYVLAGISIRLSSSLMIGIVVLDGYCWFILASVTKYGTYLMTKSSTTLPDHMAYIMAGNWGNGENQTCWQSPIGELLYYYLG